MYIAHDSWIWFAVITTMALLYEQNFKEYFGLLESKELEKVLMFVAITAIWIVFYFGIIAQAIGLIYEIDWSSSGGYYDDEQY